MELAEIINNEIADGDGGFEFWCGLPRAEIEEAQLCDRCDPEVRARCVADYSDDWSEVVLSLIDAALANAPERITVNSGRTIQFKSRLRIYYLKHFIYNTLTFAEIEELLGLEKYEAATSQYSDIKKWINANPALNRYTRNISVEISRRLEAAKTRPPADEIRRKLNVFP